MKPRRLLLAWFVLLSMMLLVFGSQCFAAPPDQTDELAELYCPIMPENHVLEEFYSDYNGKRYYFCCEECVADFVSDPSRFVTLESVRGFPLDEIERRENASGSSPDAQDSLPYYREPVGLEAMADRYFTFTRWLTRTASRYHLNASLMRWHLVAGVGLLLYPVASYGWKRRRRETEVFASKNSTWKRGLVWTIGMLLVADTCFLAYRVLDGNAQRDEQQAELKAAQTQLDRYKEIDIENDVHYATFINYGFPPRPRPSNKPNSLSAVYYRGNDERTDTMFNGGQYLTVTFELQLETEDGQPIEFGQWLGDQKPWLAIRFIRAADTSAGYYTREYMSRMYLSMKAERALGRDQPVEDRVAWIEVESSKVWEARYPLPAGDQFHEDWQQRTGEPISPDSFRGVIYLVEERTDGEIVQGGRYHYAVEYALLIEDGKVSEQSNLLMGSTYRGHNFTDYQITDEQWLSLEPIPEKPAK